MKTIPIFNRIISEDGVAYGIVEGTEEKIRLFDSEEE